MSRETAMLPRVDLTRPGSVIGTNTIDAMKSGIVFGYVAMVEGMVARIQRELGTRAKVVATGGYAALVTRETRAIDEVNPDLTLIGLRLVYRMNQT
jgi:type III pantothenate kinase